MPMIDKTRNSIFFDMVYPNTPFIHPRYHDPAAILPKARQPPLALKYAMWTLAAIHSHHLSHKAQSYYKSARMHLEHDEMDVRITPTTISNLTISRVMGWDLSLSTMSRHGPWLEIMRCWWPYLHVLS